MVCVGGGVFAPPDAPVVLWMGGGVLGGAADEAGAGAAGAGAAATTGSRSEDRGRGLGGLLGGVLGGPGRGLTRGQPGLCARDGTGQFGLVLAGRQLSRPQPCRRSVDCGTAHGQRMVAGRSRRRGARVAGLARLAPVAAAATAAPTAVAN